MFNFFRRRVPVRAYVMSQDAKWMEKVFDLPLTPHPGMDLDGLVEDQPLRISGMSYHVHENYIKLRLAWLSQDPMHSTKLTELGWTRKD